MPKPFLLNIHIASPKKHNGPGAPLFQKCVPVENFDNFVDNLSRSVDFFEKKNQNIFKKNIFFKCLIFWGNFKKYNIFICFIF